MHVINHGNKEYTTYLLELNRIETDKLKRDDIRNFKREIGCFHDEQQKYQLMKCFPTRVPTANTRDVRISPIYILNTRFKRNKDLDGGHHCLGYKLSGIQIVNKTFNSHLKDEYGLMEYVSYQYNQYFKGNNQITSPPTWSEYLDRNDPTKDYGYKSDDVKTNIIDYETRVWITDDEVKPSSPSSTSISINYPLNFKLHLLPVLDLLSLTNSIVQLGMLKLIVTLPEFPKGFPLQIGNYYYNYYL